MALQNEMRDCLAGFFNTHRMVEEYAEKAYNLQRQKRWKFVGSADLF